MAKILPFKALRPDEKLVHRVAALPYDVYNRKEAYLEAAKDRLSFLNIDRPETQFPEDFDMYSEECYMKARDMLAQETGEGVYQKDTDAYYYLYELTMNGRAQTGLVAVASIDDYKDGIIKKHENTREEKEQDRIRHVDTCSAQTGPIFLAYRKNEEVSSVVSMVKSTAPLYDFTSSDSIRHRVWIVKAAENAEKIRKAFEEINRIYIADGHHRAASAVKVGFKRREEAKASGTYSEDAEYNYFLSVLFPENELFIMPYNRVVKDLNGLSEEEFLEKIQNIFTVTESPLPVEPSEKCTFGMYMSGKWYKLSAPSSWRNITDPVKALDVALLQDNVLSPILGIEDPRTDKRIDFVGGIRGLKELEKRAESDMKLALSMYPTSITELFDVADAGMLMPPKSTWFEPKLRSGIFIHEI